MKKIVLFLFVLLTFLFGVQLPSFAQVNSGQTVYEKAKVQSVSEQGVKTIDGVKNPYQTLQVQLLDGGDKGKQLTIKSGYTTTLTPSQVVRPGDTVILSKTQNSGNQTTYQVYDSYRINVLLYSALVFILVVILIAGWKGVGSIFGLLISLLIIVLYIVPHILSGGDPLFTSILGSVVILVVTTYLAHGISRQTTVALLSTFFALMLTAWISSFLVNLSHVSGFTEETSTLQFGITKAINLRGLLLGGIIIGTLGALNDVTTTQSASVFELAATDPKLRFGTLFKKGFSIGREHVVSMVNTLVLAYAGSALALFLFLVLNPQKVPLWVIINSEEISDEIVRTLSGSLGLILVVPIVTLLASLMADAKVRNKIQDIIYSLR